MTAAPHSISVTFRRGRYHAACAACDWTVSKKDEARALYLGGLHSQWLSDPRSQQPAPPRLGNGRKWRSDRAAAL